MPATVQIVGTVFSGYSFDKFLDMSCYGAQTFSSWNSTAVTSFHSWPLTSTPHPVCRGEDVTDKVS